MTSLCPASGTKSPQPHLRDLQQRKASPMGGAFLCLLAAFPFLSGQKKTAPARRRRTMYHSGGADGPHFVPHRGQSAGHLPLRISRMLFQPGFQGVDDDRAEVIIAGLAEVPGHILARMQHGGAHAAVIALPASLFPARDDLGRRVGIPIRPSPALTSWAPVASETRWIYGAIAR